MAKGQQSNTSSATPKSDWDTKPWTTLIGRVLALATLIGIGFGFGSWTRGIQAQNDLNNQRIESNEKLQAVKDSYNQKLLEYETKRVDVLEAVVKEYKKMDNGSK